MMVSTQYTLLILDYVNTTQVLKVVLLLYFYCFCTVSIIHCIAGEKSDEIGTQQRNCFVIYKFTP